MDNKRIMIIVAILIITVVFCVVAAPTVLYWVLDYALRSTNAF